MEDKIISIIASHTGHSVDYLNTHKKERKLWNSLQRVEIVLLLEEEFDIMFEPEEIKEMLDIESISRIISGKVS